jgi:hypothetical protein|tara:strand:- start:410 stop:583 length:174 start_codon:yes stop_codon:yes gene_type:complete
MRIFLTEFTLDGVLYDGPQLLADSRHEAQLMAEGSGLIIVDEIKDMVLTEAGLETLH